jgi:hypothetical protein
MIAFDHLQIIDVRNRVICIGRPSSIESAGKADQSCRLRDARRARLSRDTGKRNAARKIQRDAGQVRIWAWPRSP